MTKILFSESNETESLILYECDNILYLSWNSEPNEVEWNDLVEFLCEVYTTLDLTKLEELVRSHIN